MPTPPFPAASAATSLLNSEKRRLRDAMKALLDGVSSKDATIAGEAISDQVSDWSSWESSSVIALFSSLPGEIDTRPLIERCQREGKRLLFPRMTEGPSLEFAVIEKVESLRPGRYGVREPDEACPAHALTEDVVVFVPGLAFDREGGRLGRGGGYYDRALAECGPAGGRPLFIGLAFDRQFVDAVAMSANDIRMDWVLTERELVRCSG